MVPVAVLFWIVVPAFAQQESRQVLTALPAPAYAPDAAPHERTFFPKNWVRGHIDFEAAPSHNEPDLGRCSQAPAGQFGGASSACTAYARYILSGYIELQPIGRTFLRHVFLFSTPRFFFGRNVPQFLYTASFLSIADERSLGVAVELPKHFELRLSGHHGDWLGRYRGNLGGADLGTNGPYGNYATVGARWSFGGWDRSHGE
jgi:hypothetical protein